MMKRKGDIRLWVNMVLLLLLAGGCSGIIYDNYSAENDPEEADLVTLVLNVGLVSPTRAAADNDRELMHSLRIVLLEDQGTVEYNERIDFAAGMDEYAEGIENYRYIFTHPGKKKIFLIANEEGVPSVQIAGKSELSGKSLTNALGSVPAGSLSKDFETMVNAIVFSGDYAGYIPLSSSYEFEIKEDELTPDNRRVMKEFYLVYAATKFEFRFENYRESDVTINHLSVGQIAGDMYLMTHFTDTSSEQKTVLWGQDAGGQDQEYFWIDWLKMVSDATQAPNDRDPANETINGTYGWLTDYEVPSTTHYSVKDIVTESTEVKIVSKNDATDPLILPIVYFSESKNIPDGRDQEYYFTVSLTASGAGSKTFKRFLSHANNLAGHTDDDPGRGAAENLQALFRNTHVVVTVRMYGSSDIELSVMLRTWEQQTGGDIKFQ